MSVPTSRKLMEDHPRIRGEHASVAKRMSPVLGSSPHTRGAPRSYRWSSLNIRIIPAYAGSTPSRRSTRSASTGSSPHTRGAPARRRCPAIPPTDHPRIRGEHDPSSGMSLQQMGSSPHTRGARDEAHCRIRVGRIIPAYAGSTRRGEGPASCRGDHPRIRGEHGSGSLLLGCVGGIIPAYAGSTGGEVSLGVGERDHPRIRGEHRRRHHFSLDRSGSSPHTRGAQDRPEGEGDGGRIIPAYAGSTRCSRRARSAYRDHPRIRGEHLHHHEIISCSRGSSPHTRGARNRAKNDDVGAGIIPAYAGSTSSRKMTQASRADHPRIRGEHSRPSTSRRTSWGSSPHTRGALVLQPGRFVELGIIPAYAGSTGGPSGCSPWREDHPRIRGEHLRNAYKLTKLDGSSPHTRGALRHPPGPDRRQRIIPAYAGSTKAFDKHMARLEDHPRIRGEHRGAGAVVPARRRIIPAYAGSTDRRHKAATTDEDHPRIRGEHLNSGAAHRVAQGSSPHTRGAHGNRFVAVLEVGIIPAYAGSTCTITKSSVVAADHPRIRGEHAALDVEGLAALGSSPHTRGAHRHRPARRHGGGIIPAYAGSTGSPSPPPSGGWDHPRIRGEHR